MHRKLIFLTFLSLIGGAATAQVFSDSRIVPPTNSAFVSGPASIAALGLHWDEFSIEVLSGGIALQPITDPQTTLKPALMKAKEKANRTKCANNLRMTFTGTGFTPDQEDYDFDVEFEGQFENSTAKIKIPKNPPKEPKTGHVSINRREIAPGVPPRYEITATMEVPMLYSPDGNTWYNFDAPVAFDLQPVPEPASIVGLSACLLALRARRRKSS